MTASSLGREWGEQEASTWKSRGLEILKA